MNETCGAWRIYGCDERSVRQTIVSFVSIITPLVILNEKTKCHMKGVRITRAYSILAP
jgi:hypothetical protein